jgi:hypothetical protein
MGPHCAVIIVIVVGLGLLYYQHLSLCFKMSELLYKVKPNIMLKFQ